mmetsp:Transcript_23113/g.59050  ORF Transcript_23113/g.59050 Transcript_23113/m.59050 type:complete len:249 (-) Transcript_23113:491-1237(-)
MRSVAHSSPRNATSDTPPDGNALPTHWNARATTSGGSAASLSALPPFPCTARPCRKTPGVAGDTSRWSPSSPAARAAAMAAGRALPVARMMRVSLRARSTSLTACTAERGMRERESSRVPSMSRATSLIRSFRADRSVADRGLGAAACGCDLAGGAAEGAGWALVVLRELGGACAGVDGAVRGTAAAVDTPFFPEGASLLLPSLLLLPKMLPSTPMLPDPLPAGAPSPLCSGRFLMLAPPAAVPAAAA